MKRIRVCHLTSVHGRFDDRIFLKMCKELSGKDFEVTLVVADGKGNEKKDGVEILDVGQPTSRKNRILKTRQRVFKKALEVDASIYHFHDPELLGKGAKLVNKGKKVIYDVHEDLPRQILTKPYLPKWVAKMMSNVIELVEHRYARKLSGIITATPFIRRRFEKINPNTIDVKNYPILKEFTIKKNWSERGDNICYVGGIFEVRGINELVQALPNSEVDNLLLAGTFSPENLEVELAKKTGWSKVKYFGFVDREGINSILNDSKVGMVTLHPLPSYKDALPVKLFEYMAAGIPVVISDFPLWREIVGDSNCGIFVNPLDVEEIKTAINQLLEDGELAQKMGKNGKDAVENKYNWEKEMIELVKFYESLL